MSFQVFGPMDLRTVKDTLTWMFEDPVVPSHFGVLLNRCLHRISNTNIHEFLDFAHPVFHLFILGINFANEFNFLTFP